MQTMMDPENDGRNVTCQRVLIAATIRYANGIGTVACVVRNLSETGAKLAVTESVTLPEHFELVMPQKNVIRRCVLRWRRGDEAGVSFLDVPAASAQDTSTPASTPGAAPAAGVPETPSEEKLRARIRMLEAENARLKARIAQLGG